MNSIYRYVTLFAIALTAFKAPAQNIFQIPTDVGIFAIVSPSIGGCYGATQSVVVTIQNFGTNPVSNIPVSVILSGPINQTISSSFPGSLAAGASTNFTVGNVNMSIGGVYTFSAYTTLVGDGNANNDNSITSRTVSPSITINGPSAICTGGSATLTANGGATYSWSTGSNSTNIVVSPTVTTSYSVIGTNTAGCSAISLYTLSVSNPTITTTGGNGCGNPSNGTLTASAFSPAIINWYASPVSTLVLGTGSAFPVSSSSNVTYYAEALSTTPGSLFTTLAGGNSFNGNMFDVSAINTVTINGLDWHFNSNTTSTVEVWYRSGTFVGFENSNAGWTLAHTTTVTPLGTGSLTTIPGTFAIAIPAGQIYGIYVTTNGGSGINYTNGSVLGNMFTSNADLQFFEGKGGGYFSVNNSPRIFNGTIKYARPGCSSPRVPTTYSVVSGVTVTAITNATSVCQGASATFTAFGAVNYTWFPSANIGPSPNATIVTASPTANTTYTVMGTSPSCTNTGSYTLNLSTLPSPTLTITPSQTVAAGTFLNIGASGAFTYSWAPGGSNNNNILVSPMVTTVYTVTGANSFGCTSSITTTVTIGTVGLDKNTVDDKSLILFPNPGNGQITVLNNGTVANYVFELFDINGKLVFKEAFNRTENRFNFKELNNGLYFFRIISSDNIVVKQGKLVKE